MDWNKTYCKIQRKDKDVVFWIHRNKHSSLKLIWVYSSISDGYMGLEVQSFIESIRGFLREYPNFFEEVDYSRNELENWLKNNGFREVEPDATILAVSTFQDKE